MQSKLFSKTKLGNLELKNPIVMAPMTRCRAINNVPNDLMATFYGQRAEAGLIITEGTSPSANGLGYARIPGIFNDAQVEGWKKVTSAIHAKGSRIFVQLMHVGRVGHPNNLPEGAELVSPSAIAAKGQMWTDKGGMQDQPTPREMNKKDLEQAKQEFVHASENAIKAGFDGVELHAANGYLLEQFLNPASNQRTDEYGGSFENRCRFVIEVAKEVASKIGKDKTGIRLSPYGAFNDVGPFPGTEEEYAYLATKLNEIGLVYIHLVDHSSMGAPKVETTTVKKIRENFKNVIILSGGYDKKRAEADLDSNGADLIAFGRPFLANPDLVSRLQKDAPLASPDMSTFYSADEKGYTDYPMLKEAVTA